jgi:hypothetical protein
VTATQATQKEEAMSTGTTRYTGVWAYRDPSYQQTDLTGFKIEATDGSIGKIDEATYEVGSDYIVVDTGPWILGKKVMLPAGVISRIDSEDEHVFVDRTKDEIKNAPEFDENSHRDSGYRDQLGSYYGGFYN